MNISFNPGKTCRLLLSVLAVLWMSANARAANETVTAYSSSPNLKNNTRLTLEDSKYNIISGGASSTWGFVNKNVKNKVIFRVDHRNQNYQPNNYTAIVTYDLIYKTWNGTSLPPTTISNNTLEINFKKDGSNQNDKAVYAFTGGLYMEVQVTGLSVKNGPTDVPASEANLKLELEIETERYYTFDPLFVPADVSHRTTDMATSGELEIFWKYIAGAEEYDLEWMYINNYKPSGEMLASELDVTERSFQFNSTRVTTSDNYYKIPNIYGKGYILYRVRGIGKTNKDDYTDYIPGAWSSSATSYTTVAGFTKKYKNTTAHQDNLNWQFSATYAEEGKSKAVVNYFDGSLRNRQSVTKSKTNEQIIVGESIYDYEGRPAIQVLPVPMKDAKKIEYKANFNQNMAGQAYSKKDFDESANACAPLVAGMKADTDKSGAAYYYSSSNTDKANQQAYLPDAENYPFAQVEYAPDNTGRIRAQGGVGKTFQLDGKHTTNYFYTAPEQKELDRLFGSEAGDALRYKKNMVRDANGQLSISYLDPQGRVVATALSGAAPNTLDVLTSARNEEFRTDLLNKVKQTDFTGSRNELDLSTRSLSFSKQVVPETNGAIKFSYQMNGQKYEPGCTPTICYNCVFDLKINLTDDCGEQYLSGAGVDDAGGVTAPYAIGNANATPNCSTTPATFSKGVGSGGTDTWTTRVATSENKTYMLTKTLTLNEKALDNYTWHYMEESGNCLKNYQFFKDQEDAKLDWTTCTITCSECLTRLGPFSNYNIGETPNCAPCLTYEEYKKLEDQCKENCDDQPNACDAGYESLLSDVSLMGQYGQVVPGGGMLNGSFVDLDESALKPELFPLSVFNEANQLPRKKSILDAYTATSVLKNSGWVPSWRYPYNPEQTGDKQFSYLTEEKELALIPVREVSSNVFSPEITIAKNLLDVLPDGRLAVRPQFLKYFADFAAAWEPSWGHALVAYHPEYEYYRFCISIAASHDFDGLWQAQEHVDNLPDGWDLVIDVPGTPAGRLAYMDPVTSGLDPYFNIQDALGAAEKNAMQNAMKYYVDGKSIWEMAYRTANCPNANGVMNCSTCVYVETHNFNDKEWEVFRGMYIALKQKFVQQRATRYAIEHGAYNGCIGKETFDPFLNKFYQSTQSGTGAPWSSAPFNRPFLRSQFFNFEQPCNAYRYALYKEKQVRFPGVSDLLDIPSLQDEVCQPYVDTENFPGYEFEKVDCKNKLDKIVEETENLAELALYKQCGQCPSARNLEAFLDGMVNLEGGSKLVSPTQSVIYCDNQSEYPMFTNNFAKMFLIPNGGLFTYVDLMRYQTFADINDGKPTLQILMFNEPGSCSLDLQFTILPTLTTVAPNGLFDLYNFSDFTKICCLKGISDPIEFSYTPKRNFRFTATVKVKAGDPIYEEDIDKYRDFIIEGKTTCFDIDGCSFDEVCRASKEALQLQTLMNAMLYDDPSTTSVNEAKFLSTTAVNLKDQPFVSPIYQAIQPALNKAKNVMNVSNEYNWYWQLNSGSSNFVQIQMGIDPAIMDHAHCNISFTLPPLHDPTDIKRFSNITPITNAPGEFKITVLMHKSGEDPEFITVNGSMTCLNLGECGLDIPAGMANGSSKSTAQGLGKTCTPNSAALSMMTELNTAYIIPESKTRNFTCTGKGLEFTFSYTSCGTLDGVLYFPQGSEYGNCATGDFLTYRDIVAFTDVAPDKEFSIPGQPVYNFIITATMSNGVKVQMKGHVEACTTLGNCYEVVGDCSWAENRVKNGNLEEGIARDFISEYSYSSTLSGDNTYTIVEDASAINSLWTRKDHTSGYSKFLVAHSGSENKAVWKQSNVKVDQHTEYLFSAWFSKPRVTAGKIGEFKMSVNGDLTSEEFSPVFDGDGKNGWVKMSFNWNSGENETVDLKIISQAANYDFCLDDIGFQACELTMLCDIVSVPPPKPVKDPNPCYTQLQQIATTNALIRYSEYLDGVRKEFRENYIKKCLEVYEDFHMSWEDTQHHFTLYYYDQAGNLVRTVPPEGVHRITDEGKLEQVRLDRFNRTHTVFTEHEMATTYKYNSLNQLVSQSSPDVENLNIWKTKGITGIPSTHVISNTVFSDATHGTAFTKDASGKGHLYVTSNGSTWTELTSIGLNKLNDVQVVSSTVAYAVGDGGMVMETTDGGSQWNVLPAPPTQQPLIACAFSSAGTGHVFDNLGAEWSTTDAGVTWTPVSNGLGALIGSSKLSDLAISGSTETAVTENGKIFIKTGGVWEASTNIRTVDLNKISENNGKYYIAGTDGRFLRSLNTGLSWELGENTLNKNISHLYFDYPFQGWAIGEDNTLLRTDGAQSWAPVAIPQATNPQFTGLHFSKLPIPNEERSEGYAVTASGLYSVYNGSNWSALSTTTVGSNNIEHIYGVAPLASTNLLFMATSTGQIYKKPVSGSWTTFGNVGVAISDMRFAMVGGVLRGAVLGSNGHLYRINESGSGLDVTNGHTYTCMSFISANNGYAIATDGHVATTNDGGDTWTSAAGGPVSANLTSLLMKSSSSGMAVGQAGAIWKWDGTSWTNISDKVALPLLNSVNIENSTTAYITGRDGLIVKTTNLNDGDAANWKQQATGTSKSLKSVATSGSAGVTCGDDGFAAYTSIGGDAWTTSTSGTTAGLNKVILNSTTAYAAGSNGTVLKSTNSGNTWTAMSITDAAPQTLLDIESNGSNLLAVGEKGKVLRYNGTSWSVVNTFTPPVINDAQMLGANGIAVGNGGSIMNTTNRGQNWNVQLSGTVKDLNGVYMFAGSNEAIAVGKTAAVIRTTDGGTSWSPVSGLTNTTTNWNAIDFANNVGVVVGDNGHAYTIVKNSIETWTDHDNVSTGTASTVKFNAVHVVDGTMAYVVGSEGVIRKVTFTNNGATATWSTLSHTLGSSVEFTDVFFRDYQTGYVIGKGGKIIKTINGGANWSEENIGVGAADNLDISALDNHNIIISGGGGKTTHLHDLKDEAGSLFWYDKQGRLVVSQNAKQYEKSAQTYSYTIYDELGRIKEVGETESAEKDPIMAGTGPIEDQYENGELSTTLYNSWIMNGTRTEITRTKYDVVTAPSGSNFTQDNLRKRVSATYVDSDADEGVYDHATFYSYDIHGNVKSLLQHNPHMGSDEYKRIDYEYDLISGNVKKVSYQKNQKDAYYHEYLYDADNRITHVFTSKDNIIWDEDVKYFYYKHGPLARTELGNEKVQAIDYAYTLQGWIKGINSTNLNSTNDIGKDGQQINTNPNKHVGNDVYSYSLNYFGDDASTPGFTEADYKVIEGSSGNFMASAMSVAYGSGKAQNLYNGNISSMATTIYDDHDVDVGTAAVIRPQLTGYRYDQLNRIRALQAYQDRTPLNKELQNNSWDAATNNGAYASTMIYDANGNLDKMFVNGNDASKLSMDDLDYTYEVTANGQKTNRLDWVKDDGHATNYTTDVKMQAVDNYGYDKIGNLIRDNKEDIGEIEWSVYGKIKRIERNGTNAKPEFLYAYDAQGNRISKTEKPRVGGVLQPGSSWKTTYYVRDGGGNVMSTYTKEGTNALYLEEQQVYGSSRTGIHHRGLSMSSTPDANKFTRELGKKEYELSNHLGNVLSTISDTRTAHYTSGTTTDVYQAKQVSAQDYFAFGAMMPGRGLNGSLNYRYGFGGQEKDDEINGVEGSSYTAEYWQYDSRLGRRWNLDPIPLPNEASYVAFRNNPILYNDPKGDCPDCNTVTQPNGKITSAANSHSLLDKKGEIVTNVADPVYKIKAGDVGYNWNEEKNGYFNDNNEEYSNPNGSWYDGIVEGTANFGESILSLATKEGWYDLANGMKNSALFIEGEVTNMGPVKFNTSQEYQAMDDRFTHWLNEEAPNYGWYEWSKMSTEMGWAMLTTKTAPAIVAEINPFGLRGGFGPFGANGLVIKNYRIDLLYSNPNSAGGTIFSLKQMTKGGNLIRLDYGKFDKIPGIGFHLHTRGVMFGVDLGKTTVQRSVFPPFKPLR